uniref:Uncharacterized protein n=1 Tax=Cacopsylla melanoneura TaxID=428564 RepID=A0A8D8SEM3_9HEMI
MHWRDSSQPPRGSGPNLQEPGGLFSSLNDSEQNLHSLRPRPSTGCGGFFSSSPPCPPTMATVVYPPPPGTLVGGRGGGAPPIVSRSLLSRTRGGRALEGMEELEEGGEVREA